jgi:anti-sigma B factor antagonist
MSTDRPSPTSLLKITERQVGEVTILDLEGSIIMGGGSLLLRDELRSLVERGRTQIILNFADVKYVDSSGIGELVSGWVTLNRAEGRVKLLNLSEKISEVLALSSTLALFETYDDEARAIEAFG